MNKPLCTKCGAHPASWSEKDQWWEFCSSCKKEAYVKNVLPNRLSEAGIPYKDIRFSSFNKEKITALKEASNKFHTNIMMKGESFTGKTSLLCAIVNEILSNDISQKVSVRFFNTFDLMFLFKEEYIAWGVVERCKACTILILDDLVNQYNNTEYKYLYTILNHRNNEGLTTHSSTNMDIQDARLVSRLLRDGGLEVEISKNIWK